MLFRSVPTHPPTVSTSTIQTKAPVTPPHTFLCAREHPEGSPVNPPTLSELLLTAADGGDPTPNAGITEHTTPASTPYPWLWTPCPGHMGCISYHPRPALPRPLAVTPRLQAAQPDQFCPYFSLMFSVTSWRHLPGATVHQVLCSPVAGIG